MILLLPKTQTGRKKERGTTEEEMEGPTPILGLRKRKNV